jgi:hypothetical protein
MNEVEGEYELGFEIHMTVRNEWRNVDLLRTSVQNCFAAVFAHVDGCNALAMVTSELLENALKYGDWQSGHPAKFRFSVHGKQNSIITVRVQNPLPAHDPTARALLTHIAWIDSFESPDAAYRERLTQIAGSDAKSPSRLGLVRIVFEGRCRLSAHVESGNAIVTAQLDLAAL